MLIEQIILKSQELTSKILDVISSNQLLIIPLAILSNFL